MAHPTPEKARMMLREGTAHGKALTARQKRWLGLIASGKTPTRMKGNKKSRRKKIQNALHKGTR